MTEASSPRLRHYWALSAYREQALFFAARHRSLPSPCDPPVPHATATGPLSFTIVSAQVRRHAERRRTVASRAGQGAKEVTMVVKNRRSMPLHAAPGHARALAAYQRRSRELATVSEPTRSSPSSPRSLQQKGMDQRERLKETGQSMAAANSDAPTSREGRRRAEQYLLTGAMSVAPRPDH